MTSFTRNSSAASGAKIKLDCQYDYRSRRTQKIVSTWNGSAYVAQSTNKFVYDGWNLIAILDATNGLVQSFTWGTDASGTLQGAGGVGGLISMTIHQGANAGTYFYCFDGNHNVATLMNATNGALEAVYELDAFLRILRATGRLALVNPFVGSTKFCDWETGFLYYGYRYYDPETGRWLSRDPIEEQGEQNLYGFVRNEPVGSIDLLGLEDYMGYFKWTHKPEKVEAMDYYISDLGPLPGEGGRTKPKTFIDAICENTCEWVPQANANTTFSIILNSRLNILERTGSYGHEQRHVQRFIEQYFDFMEAEDELWRSRSFASKSNCQKFLAWRIEEILAAIERINKSGANHKSGHPAAGEDYDPIGGMPLNPSQGVPP